MRNEKSASKREQRQVYLSVAERKQIQDRKAGLKEKGERIFLESEPDGALPLFIGGGDHVVVRGCRKRVSRKEPGK